MREQGCNINDYQLKRFMEEARKKGLAHLLSTQKASFEELPFEDNSVDAIYELEAFCHAGDLKKAYSEAFRVLKPGQSFCSFEWVLTDKFDFKNPEHLAIKKGIEEGNGLIDMHPVQQCVDAAKAAGFEVVEARDVSDGSDLSWYHALARDFSIVDFSFSKVGRNLSGYLCGALEAIKLAPKGTKKINDMLCKTANFLVTSGKLGIFSPTYMLLVRKPLSQ